MKNFLYTIGASLICASALAQEATPGQIPATTTPEPVPTSSNDGLGQVAPPEVEKAIYQAQKWLRGKGCSVGYDSKKDAFFAIGQATIQGSVDDPSWGEFRNIAYQEALLGCKKNLAEFIGLKINRTINSSVEKPNRTKTVSDSRKRLEDLQKAKGATEGTNKSDLRGMSMMDKAALLATSELDKLLTERGHIDPSDPAKKASEEAMMEALAELRNPKNISSEYNFRDTIEVAARTEAAGMLSLVTFEAIPKGKDGSIAVIGYISKSSKEMALAILNKAPKVVREDKKKESVFDWVDALTPSTLLFSHGVLSRYDEKGELWLIAFGQSTPESADEFEADIALEMAETNAMGALRSFAGEAVTLNRRKDTALNTVAYRGLNRTVSKDVTNSGSYFRAMSAVAVDLTLVGALPLRSWDCVHPQMSAAGFDIATCGVVYGWKVSNKDAAHALGELLESIGGSKGDASVATNTESDPKPGSGKKKRDNESSEGKGAEGEIDD